MTLTLFSRSRQHFEMLNFDQYSVSTCYFSNPIKDSGQTLCVISASSGENLIFAYAKTKTQISFVVTAKLISAFVFATGIVQYLRNLKTLTIFCRCTAWFVSDLVGNHKDRFSHNQAHIIVTHYKSLLDFGDFDPIFKVTIL